MAAIERLTWVGHATVLVELDGARVLTDPVLRRRVGPLRRHGARPAPELAEGIDAVLVSHLHHDHADLPSLRMVGPDVPVLAPPGSAGLFGRKGFSAVSELAPGESRQVGRTTIMATEAEHRGGRHFAGDSGTVGYVIAGSRRVYFAGDTDLFEGMEELGEGLDLALLPIWGWGAGIGEGHLDPERAACAASRLMPRIAVPIHWGTLYPIGLDWIRPGPLRRPGPEFLRWMRKLAPQVEARVLEPGEATSLS